MIDLEYLLKQAHEQIEARYVPSRERSLALTKLDEAALWLTVAPSADD